MVAGLVLICLMFLGSLQHRRERMALFQREIQSLVRTLWLASILFTAFGSALSAEPTEQPNILFIYLDDFGWKDTGYMGSDFYETPNIDKLAKQGIIFSDAYSCAANCAPARACLLSGQYTPRHKIYNVDAKPRGKSAHRRLKHVPGVKTLDSKIEPRIRFGVRSESDQASIRQVILCQSRKLELAIEPFWH